MKRGVFVDSSAWIALVGGDSGRHPEARAVWKGLEMQGRSLFTTDYVLDETYTLLRRSRGGLPLAIEFHYLVTASEVIEVVEVEEGLRGEAWVLFTRYSDQVLSFTDCVSFAAMRRRELDEAFTFDADFRRVGFRTLPVG